MLLPLHRMRREVTQLPCAENRALFSFWLEGLRSLYYESKERNTQYLEIPGPQAIPHL